MISLKGKTLFLTKLKDRLESIEKSIQNLERGKVSIPLEVVENGKRPIYAHLGDAGADLYAREDIVIEPGKTKLVPLGIKLAIPEGYEVQVRPRSGMSYKTSLRVIIGTVDSGFRGEISAIMWNGTTDSFSNTTDGVGAFYIDGSPISVEDFKRVCELLLLDPDTTSPEDIQNYVYVRKGDRVAQMVVNKVAHASFNVTSDVNRFGVDRGGGWGSSGLR